MNMKHKEATGFRLVFGYLGIFLMFEGLITLLPLFVAIFYPGEWVVALDFAIPAGIGVVLGAALFFGLIAGREKGHFARNDDALLLVLLWFAAVVLGSLPFYFTEIPLIQSLEERCLNLGMTYSECFFEAMSGYSATGLTVLPNQVFLPLVLTTPYPPSMSSCFTGPLCSSLAGLASFSSWLAPSATATTSNSISPKAITTN
jgi:trk system potassium uptake protein TrkH